MKSHFCPYLKYKFYPWKVLLLVITSLLSKTTNPENPENSSVLHQFFISSSLPDQTQKQQNWYQKKNPWRPPSKPTAQTISDPSPNYLRPPRHHHHQTILTHSSHISSSSSSNIDHPQSIQKNKEDLKSTLIRFHTQNQEMTI